MQPPPTCSTREVNAARRMARGMLPGKYHHNTENGGCRSGDPQDTPRAPLRHEPREHPLDSRGGPASLETASAPCRGRSISRQTAAVSVRAPRTFSGPRSVYRRPGCAAEPHVPVTDQPDGGTGTSARPRQVPPALPPRRAERACPLVVMMMLMQRGEDTDQR